jgi:DNA-binding MarR family transcriptional regulator
MSASLKENENDFRKSLMATYANIAIMEMRMYNDDSDAVRPTYKEVLYLYSINNIENCTATDLVELFNSSKALVSQTVIGMEEKGFITRVKDPRDNRRQIIRISEDRIKQFSTEMEIISEAVKRLSSKYSSEEIAKAMFIIEDVTKCMRAICIDKAQSSYDFKE